MTTMDSIRREYERYPPRGYRRFTRWFTKRLPTGLYGRTLLIIILPMVVLQSVIAFVFMERHWQTVTQRLSTAVTRDIAAIIDVIDTYPQDTDFEEITRIARERLELNIAIEPEASLPPPRSRPFFSILDSILSEEITRQIRRPFWIDTIGDSDLVEVRVLLDDKVLRVFARRSQAYASNTHIFLLWMVGTSLVLLTIAILFLRGQIRPILSLASAAESFGKGQKSPDDFRPRGADEIRRAGLAFMRMRERIERQIEQRTAMLTGVSHDLRTILTRFRLQLALVGNEAETAHLNDDIDDMQSMLEGYLSFARGEAQEDVGELDLEALFTRLRNDAGLHGKELTTGIEGPSVVKVRPNAFARLVTNIASNAWKHAKHIGIEATIGTGWLTIVIDDDGCGIPAQLREDVFKPFFRLDESRNQDESGTGLGLAIARDIARSHGGDVTLAESPMGGLQAVIRVPQ